MSELQVYGQPRVYVILLNWNGWQDTIECLESVFRLSYPRFTVIVCDNASSDGSMEKIQGWAGGFFAASCDSPDLARLTVPSIPKPLGFDYIFSSGEAATSLSPGSRLLLIQTGANLGLREETMSAFDMRLHVATAITSGC
jgi:GT2 family glycosyltransferase